MVIVLALGGLVYGIAAIYRLRTAEPNLPVYAIAEIDVPQEISGEALRLSIAQRGMSYAIIGDILYYANPDRNLYMYRFNLETDAHELYLQASVFGVITDGEKLFIMVDTQLGVGIFSVNPAGEMQAIAYDVDIHREFRKYRGIIFYSDINGQERTILPCGRPIVL